MRSNFLPQNINFIVEGKKLPSFKEKNLLYEGNCINFLNSLPARKRFHLIVTSPPYNIGKEYEKRTTLDEYLHEQKEVASLLTRHLSNKGSLCWQVGNYIQNGERVPLDIFFIPMFQKLGLKLRNRIIWKFGHGQTGEKRQFSGRYETILWFTKGESYRFDLDAVRVAQKYPSKRASKGPRGPIKADRNGYVTWQDSCKSTKRKIFIRSQQKGKKLFVAEVNKSRALQVLKKETKVKKGQTIVIGLPSGNKKGKNPTDVWDEWNIPEEFQVFDVPNVKANHVEKTDHPCQFPIELVERLVLSLTKKGDLVFDPFSGVGSTGCAALKNERYFWGCEREKNYNKETLTRLKLALEDPDRLPYRSISNNKYNHKKSNLSKIPPEWKE